MILEKGIIIPISKLKRKQIKDAYFDAISKEMEILKNMPYRTVFIDVLLLINGLILNYHNFTFMILDT